MKYFHAAFSISFTCIVAAACLAEEPHDGIARRAFAATIRAEKSRDRTLIASLRVLAELHEAGIRTLADEDDWRFSEPVEPHRPSTSSVAARANYVWSLRARIAETLKSIDSVMPAFGTPKRLPHALSNVDTLTDAVSENARPEQQRSRMDWLRSLEHGTFLCEQDAQLAEVAADRAITLADLSTMGHVNHLARVATWSFLGPDVILSGEGYDGTRVPVSGRVTSIAVDPSNPKRLYVGSALGGVWASLDQGRSWLPLTDDEPCLSIGALEIDQNDSRIVFAGTGDASVALRRYEATHDRPLVGHRGQGLLCSRDRGNTWTVLGVNVFEGVSFDEITSVRGRPGVVLCATTAGLFRTLDYGKTWELLRHGLPEGETTSLVLLGGVDRCAIVAIYGRGLYATDAILSKRPTWKALSDGLPLSNVGNIKLAQAQSRPDTVYALICTADSFLRGLYESHDGGATWSFVPGAPDLMQGQGFFNAALAVDPRNPNRIILGGAGDRAVHKSSLYAGVQRNDKWSFEPIGPELHIDFHAIVFDPADPRRMYVGNDGGIWTTTDSLSWQACNDGLGITQVYDLAQHPSDPDIILAGTQDNGTIVRTGAKEWVQVDNGDGGAVAFDPVDPHIVYNEFSDYRIAMSRFDGARGTFKPIYPQGPRRNSAFLAPFLAYGTDTTTLILGLDRLHVSTDRGNSWQVIPIAPSANGGAVSALALLPGNRIAVGTIDGSVAIAEETTPGSWALEVIGDASDWHVGAPYVTGFWQLTSSNVLFASVDSETGSGLWKCRLNAEPRWEAAALHDSELARQGSVFCVTGFGEWLFVGTRTGVFASPDSGTTWFRFGNGLPRTAVFDLEFHANGYLLRAATFGRGVWELEMPLAIRKKKAALEGRQ